MIAAPTAPTAPTAAEVNDLIARNVGLIGVAISDRVRLAVFARREPDEALSAGYQGLWQAARFFDPSRGRAFSTYACVCIRRAVYRACTRQRGKRARRLWDRLVSLDAMRADGDEAVAPALPDPLVSAEDDARRERDLAEVREMLAALPERKRDVLARRLRGEKLAEIAAEFGVTKQRVDQIEERALSLLRGERPAARLVFVPGLVAPGALDALPPRWAHVLRRRGEGASQRDIAGELGVRPDAVARLERQATLRLREAGAL